MKIKNVVILLVFMGFISSSGYAEEKARQQNEPQHQLLSTVHAGIQNLSYSWKAYPTSITNPKDAKLLIEREAPKTLKPGQEYTYVIKVTNQSFYQIDNVTVTEKLPEGFTLIKALPHPKSRGRELKWELGIMAPKQTEILTITGKSDTPGKLYHIGNTTATFKLNRMVTIMEVIQPSLLMKALAPENVIIGEDIPVTIILNNTGSAPVYEAKLLHVLPDHLKTKTGDKNLNIAIGDINPGQAKTVKFILIADKTGLYRNKFIVKAKDGVRASAELSINVTKPRLKFIAKCPQRRFVGNMIKYVLKVANIGDGDAKDLITKLRVPEDAVSFISANEGGRQDSPGLIVWHIKTLQPKETKELIAKVRAKKITLVVAKATTEAKASKRLNATLKTDVQGIAAILTDVEDINDPVPVGDTETYLITVTNQGSLPATNIRVTCDLEESMEFEKAEGPTKAKAQTVGEKRKVVLEPLASIPPKSKVVWKIFIKAKKAGDWRFNVNVISNQLTKPVKEDESTTFYND